MITDSLIIKAIGIAVDTVLADEIALKTRLIDNQESQFRLTVWPQCRIPTWLPLYLKTPSSKRWTMQTKHLCQSSVCYSSACWQARKCLFRWSHRHRANKPHIPPYRHRRQRPCSTAHASPASRAYTSSQSRNWQAPESRRSRSLDIPLCKPNDPRQEKGRNNAPLHRLS